MTGQSEIAYQVDSSDMSFYQGSLPLGEITKFGPNGGGRARAYRMQFFSWEQGAISQEQIQQLIEAIKEKYGILIRFEIFRFPQYENYP